jgi:hypothetical protein
MYYLKDLSYSGKYKYEIWKKDDVEKGMDGLIATFTSFIHAEICLETFNNLQ